MSVFNYRQFWEEHHQQKIPAGHHIHHKDGNHANNHIDNLQCVSAQEHYEIHLAEGKKVGFILADFQSEERCSKLSSALKGRPKSDEHRQNLKGQVRSEETRRKISIARKGIIFSDEHKAKLSKNNPMKRPNVVVKQVAARQRKEI